MGKWLSKSQPYVQSSFVGPTYGQPNPSNLIQDQISSWLKWCSLLDWIIQKYTPSSSSSSKNKFLVKCHSQGDLHIPHHIIIGGGTSRQNILKWSGRLTLSGIHPEAKWFHIHSTTMKDLVEVQKVVLFLPFSPMKSRKDKRIFPLSLRLLGFINSFAALNYQHI